MNRNAALAAVSALGLVALDVSAFSIPAVLGAFALVCGVLVWFNGRRVAGTGLYVVILAELSPVGLHVGVPLAVLYQALCVVLLVALTVPLQHANAPSVHTRTALHSGLFAAVPCVVGALAVYGNVPAYVVHQSVTITLLAVLAALLAALVVATQRSSFDLGGR